MSTTSAPRPATSTIDSTRADEILGCPACGGRGEIATSRFDWETGAYDTATCWACDGHGEANRLRLLDAAIAHVDRAGEHDAPLGYGHDRADGPDVLGLICEWTDSIAAEAQLLLAMHDPTFLTRLRERPIATAGAAWPDDVHGDDAPPF